MGIPGLETFLKLNKNHFTYWRHLNDTPLVIDANNIACALYAGFTLERDSPHYRNDIHGGDMVRYGQIVREFFDNLKKCKIDPSLVFEGSVIGKQEPGEFSKCGGKGLKRRRQDQLKRAQEFDESVLDQTTDIFLPPNIIPIFRSIAGEYHKGEIHCRIIQAPYRADGHIVRVANKLHCPVLSNNSDFFIHALKKGFIMLDMLDHKRPQPAEDDVDNWSIKATILTQDALARLMPGFNLEVMPLLDIVLGDDYIDKSVFDGMVNACNGNHDRFRCDFKISSFSHRRIVNWLSLSRDKSLDGATEFIIENVKQEDRNHANDLITSLMRNYRIGVRDELDKELESIYNKKVVSTRHETPKDYLSSRMKRHNLDSIVLDVIFHNTRYNYCGLEDFDNFSIIEINFRPISLALALLRAKSYKNLTDSERQDQAKRDSFSMYDRKDGKYAEFILEPLQTLEGYGSLDHLDCYSMIALGTNTKRRILMACFRFTAEEQKSITEVVSRLMTGEFVKQATLCFLLAKYIYQEKDPHCIYCYTMMLTLVHYAAQNDCLNEKSFPRSEERDRLLDSLQSVTVERSSKIDDNPDFHMSKKIMHSVSLLQAALKSYQLVNTLLNFPCDQPKLELYFNAVLICRNMRYIMGSHPITLIFSMPLFMEVCDRLTELLNYS